MFRIIDTRTAKTASRYPTYQPAGEAIAKLNQEAGYQRYIVVDERGAKCRPQDEEGGCNRDAAPQCKSCQYHRDNIEQITERWDRFMNEDTQIL